MAEEGASADRSPSVDEEVQIPAMQRAQILDQLVGGSLTKQDALAKLAAMETPEAATPRVHRGEEHEGLLPRGYRYPLRLEFRGNERRTEEILAQAEESFMLDGVTNDLGRILVFGSKVCKDDALRYYHVNREALHKMSWAEFKLALISAFPPRGREDAARAVLSTLSFVGTHINAYNRFVLKMQAAFLDLPEGELTEIGKVRIVERAVRGEERYLKPLIEQKPKTLEKALQILSDAVLVVEQTTSLGSSSLVAGVVAVEAAVGLAGAGVAVAALALVGVVVAVLAVAACHAAGTVASLVTAQQTAATRRSASSVSSSVAAGEQHSVSAASALEKAAVPMAGSSMPADLPCATESLVECACQDVGTQVAACATTAAPLAAVRQLIAPKVPVTPGLAEVLVPQVHQGTCWRRDVDMFFLGIPSDDLPDGAADPVSTAAVAAGLGLITPAQPARHLVGAGDADAAPVDVLAVKSGLMDMPCVGPDVWECGQLLLETVFLQMCSGEIPFPDSQPLATPASKPPSADALLLYYQHLRGQDPLGLELGRLVTLKGTACPGTVQAKPIVGMVDSGCSCCVVSPQFVAKLGLNTQRVTWYDCRLANGAKVAVSHLVDLPVAFGSYSEVLTCAVVPLDRYDFIFGKSWLTKYDVLVKWRTGLVQFRQGGRRHRLRAYHEPAPPPLTCDILCSATELKHMLRREEVEEMFWLYTSELDSPAVAETAETVQHNSQGPPGVVLSGLTVPPGVQERDATVSPEALETYLAKHADRLVDSTPTLPPNRGDFDFTFDLIPGQEPPRAVPYRMTALEIAELRKQLAELEEKGFIYPCHSPYSSPVLFVRKKPPPESTDTSAGPAGSSAVPAEPPKPSFRLVIDYRGLNRVCRISKWPVPHPVASLEAMAGKVWFSRLDMVGAYHQLRIAHGHEKYTAMVTPLGQYCWRCLPFGIGSAPAHFCSVLSQVFKGMEDEVTVFFDDIAIHTTTLERHLEVLDAVFQRLREHNFYIKRVKCEFFKHSIEYLGHKVSADGISTLESKVRAIKDWKRPSSASHVRSFLSCVGYYRKFIRDFQKIALPLNALLRKDVPFVWTQACETAFEELKEALCTAPVLHQPDYTKPMIVYTDASDLCTGAVLMQDFGTGPVPLAFDSKALTSSQRNWATHDKEMYAVMRALEVWRVYLRDCDVTIHSDHHSLQYFLRKDIPYVPRQIRWMEKLAEYPRVKIVYVKGTANVVADALSRTALNLKVAHLEGVALGDPLTARIPLLAANIEAVEATVLGTRDVLRTHGLHSQQRESFVQAYASDETAVEARADIEGNPKTTRWREQQGLLFRREGEGEDYRLYVPVCSADTEAERNRLRLGVMSDCHNTPYAGHLGRDRTLERVRRNFWWPGLIEEVTAYVRTCDVCQSTKDRNYKPLGLLRPLPVPSRPWATVGLDFVGPLPRTKNGKDGIMVITDHFTKMCHFVAIEMTYTAPQVARLFAHTCYRLHGMPTTIVSDRDPKFTSIFWKSLHDVLGTKLAMSTAYHPQTDGQTERLNRTLEEMLRAFVNEQHAEHAVWDELLWAAEFAYNDSVHSSVKQTPFFLNAGQHPHTPASLLAEQPPGATVSPATDAYLDDIYAALAVARRELARSKLAQKEYADKLRRDYTFKVGDKVMVDTKWIAAARAGQRARTKLDLRAVGPLKVMAVVSPNAVKLELPKNWHIHPVINISRMRPYFPGEERFPGRSSFQHLSFVEPAPPRDLREIESIVGARRFGDERVRQLLVRWKGLGFEYDEYVNESEVAKILEKQYEVDGDKARTEMRRLKAKLNKEIQSYADV